MLQILEEDVDVFDLIVEGMKSFPGSEEVQSQGCLALQVLLERGLFWQACPLLKMLHLHLVI